MGDLLPLQMLARGTSRHFTAAHQFGRNWSEADVTSFVAGQEANFNRSTFAAAGDYIAISIIYMFAVLF
jgi:hypothetical protein